MSMTARASSLSVHWNSDTRTLMSDLALYVHVPFCVHKCAYCDFNAYSGLGALAGDYVAAVLQDIARTTLRGRRVSSVFFGGGTPTYLSAAQLATLLQALRD